MAGYLIVAHQTAGSSELVDRVRTIAAEDPDAEFTLLVPASPAGHLLHTWEERETRRLAYQRGQAASERLAAAGVRVAAVRVGAHSPIEAVGDELLVRPDYARIILSTFPPGISRWLKGDLPGQLWRRYRLPVEHVVATPVAP